jgi:hypothetical protein
MDFSWRLRSGGKTGLVAIATLMATTALHAAPLAPRLPNQVPPPLSAPRAAYFRDHPAAWAAFAAHLPQIPAGATDMAPERDVQHEGGTWQVVTTAPNGGLCNPLLLTDGTVMVAAGDTPRWFRLTPDKSGHYEDGTWARLGKLPVIGGTQYAPLYHASAVLPDGRVVIMGGEYNDSNTPTWTNLGAIYNPLRNEWRAVTAPHGSGWTNIGDAASTLLADGTLLESSCCGHPAVDALFDAKTLHWTGTGGLRYGQKYQDEQGYELLPSGNVLTIDIWSNYPDGNATDAEQYDHTTGKWISAGHTPVPLADPYQCGNWEIGPAVLRGDGTLVAFGGNTGCVQGATADPTAIYDTRTGTWAAGPNVPAICGADKTTSCSLADAPAALLPNGNILFAASSGYGDKPTHFFEFTKANTIFQVPHPLYLWHLAGAYYYNFLVLPTGQILFTDFSNKPEIFTPVDDPVKSWAPSISSAPDSVSAGQTYHISGKQFSGRSQGAYYGDDDQSSTNYPIVRITNVSSGDVVYARTTNFSNNSVAPGAAGAADMTIPSTIESGPSELVVIANGVPSAAKKITVN